MPDREKVNRELRTLRLTLELALRNNGKLGNLGCKAGIQYVDNALTLLKEQETKAGHWIDTTKVIGFPRVQCSVCGSGQGAIWMNHCPNCGAKMEGQ